MSQEFKLAIIGAGPAGLGAAARAARCGLQHILFEKGEIGNTIYNYQLRKHVMAEPSRLALRSEVDFNAGTREAILEGWNERVSELQINIEKQEVQKILREGDVFRIRHSGGEDTVSHIIMAIGLQGTPRRLTVPGAELSHVAYTLSDPEAFTGKNILVIGAGDAAIENALVLADKNKVFILNRSSEFARAKDANSAAILDYINTGKITCFYDSELQGITHDSATIATPQGDQRIPCDQVIARLGCIMPRGFLEDCGIAFSNADSAALPVVNQKFESSVPNLYIIGSLVGYPLIKQALNQGYEVIEHIRGEKIEPADQPLIEERLAKLSGSIEERLQFVRSATPVFASLSEPQFRELIIESKLSIRKAGERIFNKNDYGDSFFSILSGRVKVEISESLKKSIEAGRFFGEMGLISGRRRSATVLGEDDVILLETPRKQMLKLIASDDKVKHNIDREFLLRALQSSIFPESSPETLVSVIERAKFRRFKRGDVLFNEGDIGDALYVIRKGSVKVSRLDRQGRDVPQTYIAAGNFVGEMALMSDEPTPRSATVTAVVPCETIVLDKADFISVIRANPRELERFQRLVNDRHVENLVLNQNHRQGELLDFMFTQGVTDADNFLMIDSDLCISCDNCEAACAATHNGFSRLDRKGGKSFASIQIPVSCRHCENPLCMLDCPPDALARQPNGEVIIKDSCIGCGNCIRNCPYGVIQLVYDSSTEGGTEGGSGLWNSILGLFGRSKKDRVVGPAKAAKCDMCHTLDGGPACVRSCPTGAAIRVNPSHLLRLVG